jgi:4-hydroxybenzoate polyprenyltransferase
MLPPAWALRGSAWARPLLARPRSRAALARAAPSEWPSAPSLPPRGRLEARALYQQRPAPPQAPVGLYRDQNDTWADRRLPAWAVPFAKLARVDRPIGTWLLLFPGWWSIALAAPAGQLPDLSLLGLFGAGAMAMRGAGCTVNDLWDRDIDGKVARTASRPLASGAVSVPAALAFLAAQSSLGLVVLLQLNTFTWGLCAASLVPVALYPLAKRFFAWPQLVLGITLNWGALAGWAAVHGSLELGVVAPLYLGGACWTLVYDTIYAHQDKADDRALGLHSSALTIGDERAKPVLAAFAAGVIGLWAVAGHAAGLQASPVFHAGLALSGAHLAWQIATADLGHRGGQVPGMRKER